MRHPHPREQHGRSARGCAFALPALAYALAEIGLLSYTPTSRLAGWAVYLPDTDFVQSFVNFPAPPAAQQTFESDNAVVVNGALTTFNNVNGGVVVALESQLDNEVERARRVERARQGWDLFIRDVKERSANTMDAINAIRMQVFYDYFRGRERNPEFWSVDEERPPQ